MVTVDSATSSNTLSKFFQHFRVVFSPHHTKTDIKKCYKAVRASSSEQMKYNAQGKHSNITIINMRLFKRSIYWEFIESERAPHATMFSLLAFKALYAFSIWLLVLDSFE
ncbi:CLUMA_CG019953, isoform A [Clunio marinus]|uniref:CLUMA_CG019953, isoform A n=1 Tax=Clunio marinus TaxID=568069 RepID=A0A1J1J3K1_9DIPT|nr:CLUMA_CG019953, isoform A [Clunio marinus]